MPVNATATTFYVSPTGSDSASGKSPGHPWRTVLRVDKARLRRGDYVLFQGGGSFADQTLMPGWGQSVSGSSSSPVVFGSYGQGKAWLPKGIWTKGERHLVFENLKLGPTQGVSGTGDEITVQGCDIRTVIQSMVPSGWAEIAINASGSHWTIRDNTIDRTGDSGMLLQGDHFLVIGNTIDNTGINPAITYGAHGIYLKASDSKIIANTISHFQNDGVSVRYRNSVVRDNTISGGQLGIAWFQYGTGRGTSRWIGNTISNTSIAGIYVSPRDIGGATDENFVIRENKIYPPISIRARAAAGWLALSLSHNRGHYRVRRNRVI